MKTQNIFQIPSIFYNNQNQRASNAIIKTSLSNNIPNNNTYINTENNTEINNIYKKIEDINIKIKIQDDKFNKIESSLETLIKIFNDNTYNKTNNNKVENNDLTDTNKEILKDNIT